MPRGRLIVVEGLDRSGKSTQCARLLARLNSLSHSPTDPSTAEPISSGDKMGDKSEEQINAVGQKFPDRSTTIGKMIDAYLCSTADLDDHAIHLLFSANRWELSPALLSHLKNGHHVICDRYMYSGIAFSVVKGLDRAWCRACDIGLPRPDLVLFLDVSEDVASQRGGYGEERYEKADLQRRVRTEFMTLLKSEEKAVNVRMIDAGQDIDAVEQDIWTHVEEVIKRDVSHQIGTIE